METTSRTIRRPERQMVNVASTVNTKEVLHVFLYHWSRAVFPTRQPKETFSDLIGFFKEWDIKALEKGRYKNYGRT